MVVAGLAAGAAKGVLLGRMAVIFKSVCASSSCINHSSISVDTCGSSDSSSSLGGCNGSGSGRNTNKHLLGSPPSFATYTWPWTLSALGYMYFKS